MDVFSLLNTSKHSVLKTYCLENIIVILFEQYAKKNNFAKKCKYSISNCIVGSIPSITFYYHVTNKK